jgi:hypothetical protein
VREAWKTSADEGVIRSVVIRGVVVVGSPSSVYSSSSSSPSSYSASSFYYYDSSSSSSSSAPGLSWEFYCRLKQRCRIGQDPASVRISQEVDFSRFCSKLVLLVPFVVLCCAVSGDRQSTEHARRW